MKVSSWPMRGSNPSPLTWVSNLMQKPYEFILLLNLYIVYDTLHW